jgi:uncharacterized membrane protein YfcA
MCFLLIFVGLAHTLIYFGVTGSKLKTLMALSSLLVLFAAAGIAGFVNAIAGGGTILTFPTLLFLGVNSIVANATSTLALILGNFGSVYGFRRQIPAVRHWLINFIPVSLAGGVLGSALLTFTPTKIFDGLVPFLLFFATVLFMAQNFFAHHFVGTEEQRKPAPAAYVAQFLISVYGGYFGAGIGILMLATLGVIGLRDIHNMNTVKTVLSCLINLVAALYFIACGLIDWPKMWIMAAGALPGYYLGSVFAQSISPRTVRRIISSVGLAITAWLFYQKFGP